MAKSNGNKPYHHGNLRDALLAAAEKLMEEQAAWTFTWREVARVAGVSHNALYNHFPDRLALLAAIAARGFDDLTVALRTSLKTVGEKDAGVGIRAAAQAYVAFAAMHPSRYRLMFSAELAGYEEGVFKQAGDQAFGVLIELIEKGMLQGRLRADPHGTHALSAWSLVHGLGILVLDRRVPIPKDDPQALATLTENVVATLFDGLSNVVP